MGDTPVFHFRVPAAFLCLQELLQRLQMQQSSRALAICCRPHIYCQTIIKVWYILSQLPRSSLELCSHAMDKVTVLFSNTICTQYQKLAIFKQKLPIGTATQSALETVLWNQTTQITCGLLLTDPTLSFWLLRQLGLCILQGLCKLIVICKKVNVVLFGKLTVVWNNVISFIFNLQPPYLATLAF